MNNNRPIVGFWGIPALLLEQEEICTFKATPSLPKFKK